MDIHEAFAWYDRAIDNAIDYLSLDREEQDKAWNVIDKFIDEAIARQSAEDKNVPTSEEVAEAIGYIEKLQQALENDMYWRSDKLMESFDLAITALQVYQPWIPVSERLPMEEPDGRHSASKMVLVYAYNGYSDRFASTDITVDGKWYDYSEPEFEVTHWMPLPEPPKGE